MLQYAGSYYEFTYLHNVMYVAHARKVDLCCINVILINVVYTILHVQRKVQYCACIGRLFTLHEATVVAKLSHHYLVFLTVWT